MVQASNISLGEDGIEINEAVVRASQVSLKALLYIRKGTTDEIVTKILSELEESFLRHADCLCFHVTQQERISQPPHMKIRVAPSSSGRKQQQTCEVDVQEQSGSETSEEEREKLRG